MVGNARTTNLVAAKINPQTSTWRTRGKKKTRLGRLPTRKTSMTKTGYEMLAQSPKGEKDSAKIDEEGVDDILRDPEVRKHFQEKMQEQAEAWAYEKVPVLGGRTPMEAVNDPDGREIVESLLVQWERHAEEGMYSQGVVPDIGRLRKILNLPVPPREDFEETPMSKRSKSPTD